MKKLLLFSVLLILISCKKKTTEPTPEPTPITTGTVAATTKTISMVIVGSTSGGTVNAVWNYDYKTPLTGLTTYTCNNTSMTFTASVPVASDSLSYGYSGPAPNSSPISFTVSVNGTAVKTMSNTMALGGYVKY